MTELLNRLPIELNNLIFSFVGKHPLAKMIEEHFAPKECIDCDYHLGCKEYDGKCVFCHAEDLGTEVYTCDECGEKTFQYGRFYNTENGLFCNSCFLFKDENGNDLDEEED